MLPVIGVIEFVNNKDRKRKFKLIKTEFGDDVTVWVEDKLLYYKLKVSPDTVYL